MATGQARSSWWDYPALLVLAGILAYGNACNGPFIFDDDSAIVTNDHIHELWSFTTFGAPVQSAVAGRPMVALSLALNYALGQLNPWGYHAWNLGIHLLAGLLLYGIARRTLATARMPPTIRAAARGLAFSSALLWLVHPLNTEVVNYVTQRTESMMGLFYLLTLYASIRAMESQDRPWRWAALAVAACAAGMSTKESMASAPVMVLVYDKVFAAASFKQALRDRRWLYMGLGATWIVLAVLIAPGPRWRSAGFSSGVTPWTYLLNQPALILAYLKLVVWPAPLVLDYGRTWPTTLLAALPAGVIVLTLVVSTMLTWLRWPALAFLATWFWITLAPTSSVLPIATEVGAERRMYLPLAAIVVLGVIGSELLRRHLGTRRDWLAGLTLAAVCGALMWLTVARNREYRTEVRIWQTVLDRRPHGRAHQSLGAALIRAGRTAEGISHYRAALDQEPAVHYALAFELEQMRQYEEAAGEYRAYLQYAPNDAQAPEGRIRLGIVLTELGKLDEAVTALETALQMRPLNLDARVLLADVFMRQARYGEAVGHYTEYVRRTPNDPAGYANLGLALIGQQREAEAVPLLERAVALRPTDGGMRLSLGNALATVGRLEEAVVQYREGIVLVPNSPVLHWMLALSLGRLGRHQEALAPLERALALNPNDQEMRDAYAQLRRAAGVDR